MSRTSFQFFKNGEHVSTRSLDLDNLSDMFGPKAIECIKNAVFSATIVQEPDEKAMHYLQQLCASDEPADKYMAITRAIFRPNINCEVIADETFIEYTVWASAGPGIESFFTVVVGMDFRGAVEKRLREFSSETSVNGLQSENNSYTRPEDVDLSKYMIYIPRSGNEGFVLERMDPKFPESDCFIWKNGIKIMQKELRTLWLLPKHAANKDLVKYVENETGLEVGKYKNPILSMQTERGM